MTQKITKLNIREFVNYIVDSEELAKMNIADLAELIKESIKKKQWNDTSLKIIYDEADNGALLLIVFGIRLLYGWTPDHALEMMCSKNLKDPYGFHAKILAYLDKMEIDYDNDLILDICLKNLK